MLTQVWLCPPGSDIGENLNEQDYSGSRIFKTFDSIKYNVNGVMLEVEWTRFLAVFKRKIEWGTPKTLRQAIVKGSQILRVVCPCYCFVCFVSDGAANHINESSSRVDLSNLGIERPWYRSYPTFRRDS